jgi:hypothetical protein
MNKESRESQETLDMYQRNNLQSRPMIFIANTLVEFLGWGLGQSYICALTKQATFISLGYWNFVEKFTRK